VPLYLSEDDVAGLLSPADAVDVLDASAARIARGVVEQRPRSRLGLDAGELAVSAGVDRELGFASARVSAGFHDDAAQAVLLFRVDGPELVAIVEADLLARLAVAAASGVAARLLATAGAASLGVIGCGRHARSQVACIRAALPGIDRVVAYCRTAERLRTFCADTGAAAAESHRDAARQEIVVTATSSPDPVLRGEWLSPGALVCAAGANDGRSRELDNVALERASFVCCDSIDVARVDSADLKEPVESGVLDWLEVHELHEVVSGEVAGRSQPEDVVVFKSNGLAAWDVGLASAVLERAGERGVGRTV
jgi:ornithine cyclodeaminase/alanine dehydrogenase-like protein (mu-crystallin family)